jgi:hypothetical protein
MLIYVNITDRQTDRQTHQKYSSEPHNIKINFWLKKINKKKNAKKKFFGKKILLKKNFG